MNLDKEYFKEIDYELNMEKYRQLHNVVLKFSNNSMEIKKLFATAIGGTIAFFITYISISLFLHLEVILHIFSLIEFSLFLCYLYRKKD